MRKEMVDVLRQPRLLLTLVIGPFLIMAAFGFGYRHEPAPMNTLFVAPADSPFVDQVKSYADQLGPEVKFAGVTSDSAAAQRRLAKGDVDLVVTFPSDPLATVLKGEQAPIEIRHTRLDPIEQSMITFASQLSIDQINGRILSEIVHSGQGLTRPAKELFAAADAAVSKVDAALGSGDADADEGCDVGAGRSEHTDCR